MPNQWDRSAMRFAAVEYLAAQGMLEVTFENGDHFVVAIETLLPSLNGLSRERGWSPAATSTAAAPAWNQLRVADTGDVLEIPAGNVMVEIPWDRLRALADPDFRAHLAAHAQERARHLGARLRAMRLAAGLAPEAVAERAGISSMLLANLEAGQVEPQTDLLQQLAGILGRRLRDFAG